MTFKNKSSIGAPLGDLKYIHIIIQVMLKMEQPNIISEEGALQNKQNSVCLSKNFVYRVFAYDPFGRHLSSLSSDPT